MKWVYWLVGIGAFGLMLYTCALPGDLPAGRSGEGLAGTYTVNGVDPLGEEYSGTVVVRTTDEVDTYDMEWIVTGSIQRGTGVRIGDSLTVDWTSVASADETTSGRGSYRIEADGRIVGTRSIDGVEEPASETLFPEA